MNLDQLAASSPNSTYIDLEFNQNQDSKYKTMDPKNNLLNLRIKEMMIPYSIGWSFVDILHLVCILVLASVLVEILFIVNMIAIIVFTVCYIRSVVPSWQISFSG